MPAAMDATDSDQLIEDWNQHFDTLRVADSTAYHLTNRGLDFIVEEWRRPKRRLDYVLSWRAITLWIVIASVTAFIAAIVIFTP